jgi:hypothetical protein
MTTTPNLGKLRATLDSNPYLTIHREEAYDLLDRTEALESECDRLRRLIADHYPGDEIFVAEETLAVQRQMDRAVELLRSTRDELDRWGWGDMHYGSTGQNPRVVAAVAAIDAFVASLTDNTKGDDAKEHVSDEEQHVTDNTKEG